jgi:regulator of sigma E protease
MNSTSIFDWVHMIAGNLWLYGGAFLLVLGILVFVHEWGHYIVARMCGVRIESFSVGFGPEIFGFSDKRGTRWKFSLVPLGGYVKMFGDTDPASAGHSDKKKDEQTQEIRSLTEAERKEAFYTQPVARRAAIVFAGPAVNFIFAIIVLTFLYTFYGEPITPPIAAAVMGGTPAETAGFMPHDEVLAIDGSPIHRFEDIRREVMVGLDTQRTFTVARNGKTIELKAIPRRTQDKDRFGFSHASGLLGLISPGNGIELSRVRAVDGQKVKDLNEARSLILPKLGGAFHIDLDRGEKKVDALLIQPLADANRGLKNPKDPDYAHLILARADQADFVKHSVPESFVAAVRETGDVIGSTLKALGQMITGMRSASELGGIIRIGAIAGDMAKAGIAALISFTALLSINLGLINLFPIPMLDGGHLLFYGVESIKGSPIPEQIQEYAFRLGLAILVGIMLFANLNDIVQLIL